MSRQRLEISIAYTDKKGVKRFANRLGNLWLDTDTMKGSIELPPGVSIHAVADAYINVAPPFEADGKPQGSGRRGGYERSAPAGSDDDGIPF
jgi:hypothetical protein